MTFRKYIEMFNGTMLPKGLRDRLARDVIPRLVQTLRDHSIEPMAGHSLSVIPPILERHPKNPRLSEISNPKFHPHVGPNNTFVVLLVRKDGEHVGCAAVRLRWISRTLSEAYQNWSLLVDSPADIPKGQRWVCRAVPALHEVRSTFVVVSGGLCLLPQEGWGEGIRTEVLRATMRLVHLAAYAPWRWSFLTAHALPWIADRHAFETDGFGITATDLTRYDEDGRTDYKLMIADRMRVEALISNPDFADVSKPLGIAT